MLKALKLIKIADKEYFPGNFFEQIDDGRDWLAMKMMGMIVDIPDEEIVSEDAIEEIIKPIKENLLTTDTNSVSVMPEIRAAGPAWNKVFLGDVQIGKTVRTKEEAQEIIDQWLDEQTA